MSALRKAWLPPAVVFLAGILMGLPTIRGGFVGGDDRQLVLNHVLVNHPSFEHAIKLFTILHRDLYQPLPLLSFSLEFVVADTLGLLDAGIERAAWLFHLTNIVLHALNGLAVWYAVLLWHRILIRRHQTESVNHSTDASAFSVEQTVALLAGLIFVLHPLQAEVVAWLNGRMMLLSTLFAVGSLIALGKWVRDRNAWWIAAGIVMVLLCGISKVRVGLPPMMLALLVCRRIYATDSGETAERLSFRRLLGSAVFLGLTFSIMGLLAVVNIKATAQAGMFDGTAEHFEGPRAARVLLSLGWYVEHYLWPSGLAAWYPSPLVVSWSDSAVLFALLTVALFGLIITFAARFTPVALAGTALFLLPLGSTLPIVPARSTLAADRYMYLPILGLVWISAFALVQIHRRIHAAARGRLRWALPALGIALSLAMLTTSWSVGMTYETYLSKTERLAQLFPNTPHVWERVGWSHFSLGNYDKAIEVAQRELVHQDTKLLGDVHGLIGLSQIKRGQLEEGMETLRIATTFQPERPLPRHRLAGALADAGQCKEAIPIWLGIMEDVPKFNPAILRLATCLKNVGSAAEARHWYDRALTNNPYAVDAILGLVEVDIQYAPGEGDKRAEARLRDLLGWMPENSAAWTNLGVVLVRSGRSAEAVRAYQTALETNPGNLAACINLSRLLLANGEHTQAYPVFSRAASLVQTDAQGQEVHDLGMEFGDGQTLIAMWNRLRSNGDRRVEKTSIQMLAWLHAIDGNLEQSKAFIQRLRVSSTLERTLAMPQILAAGAPLMTALQEMAPQEFLSAVQADDELVAALDTLLLDSELGRSARERLMRGLQIIDARRPDLPVTYCLLTKLLMKDSEPSLWQASLQICQARCRATGNEQQIPVIETWLGYSSSRGADFQNEDVQNEDVHNADAP